MKKDEIPKNSLNKTQIVVTIQDEVVCIPKKIFEQMVSALKNQSASGGRSKSVLDELRDKGLKI